MKKRAWMTILLVLILTLGTAGLAHAERIPPHGMGQIGYQAVVLCEKITIRQGPSTSAGAIKTLSYGSYIIVMNESNGWAEVILSDDVDAAPAGWVNSDYIAIDPAWYRTDAKMPVYAWNDTSAPKVGLLDEYTLLPVLKDEGDWIVVSLRGASGWIYLGGMY